MRNYDIGFKEQAIKLSEEIGASKAAKELGISLNTLNSWRRNQTVHGEAAFVGSGTKRIDPSKAREYELEKENRELRKANDILKEALCFFVKSQKK